MLERLGAAVLRTGAERAGALRVEEDRLELEGKGPTIGLLEERVPEERVTG